MCLVSLSLEEIEQKIFLSNGMQAQESDEEQGCVDIVDHATHILITDRMTLAKAVRLSSGPEELMKFIG